MSNLLHSLFLSLLPLFFFTSMVAQPNDPRHPSCHISKCANIPIRYPFWRFESEATTQYCGYQGFEIDCSNRDGGREEVPVVYLGRERYYVRNISYETNTIVLVDYDVSLVADNGGCPRVRHGIDLATLPLNFWGQPVNISFHYNCTNMSRIPDFASEIPCLSTPTNKSCVHFMSSQPPNFNWTEYSCDENLVTTVFRSTRAVATDFVGALRRGFELRWETMDDCEKCEDSGGWCGYSKTIEDYEEEFICFCSRNTTTKDVCKKGSSVEWKTKLIIGVTSTVVVIVLIVIIYCILKSPSNCVALVKHQTEDDKSVEAFVIEYGSLSTKRYTYAQIKKMTNSFRVKLGQGGFGDVFKGKLSDERLVAVKILNSSKASGQEFINEVASIGRTSHVNIVHLLGFCFEYKKRALVYEFMPNGSLEKFIYGQVPPETSERIGVDKLFEVALGIARGLDYLHRGCTTRILHLDIKPHNILLDEEFCPKIADFGLAKLYSRKESIVSMLEARGTIGYIAPEVFNRSFGGVSHKSDVYSYGMLILEMVGGRKIVDAGVGSGHTSEIYFPYWIYNRLEKKEFLLDGVTTVEENDYAKKMTIVGLWCIQTDPRQRPSIYEVIDMLEGSIEALEIPPKPFFSSPPRSPISTCNITGSERGSS